MEKHLYITDLDGTLLRSNATLSDYSRDTINKLIKEGMNFTFATARSIESSKPITKELEISLPVITANGAFLTDFKTHRHIHVSEIEKCVKKRALEIIHSGGCEPFISSHNNGSDNLYFSNINCEGMNIFYRDRVENKDRRLKKTEDLYGRLFEQVVTFNVINEFDKIERLAGNLEAELGDSLEIHYSEDMYLRGWCWLTAQSKYATKENGIRLLKEFSSLSDSKVVAFGDNVNDIKMIKSADIGVAVANALKEVKLSAKVVIGENDIDSVANYLLGIQNGN
ncbi:hypothetical protein SAMN02745945_00061 [Peptoclostridium litorale DSM 5388]|uniref:Cof-like hydrolase n=1 Tax=Peptoclostridium litorale DSM 5388 TaxID=1121324 RepID=A0A069RI65_PEPLI|nr:HAD family hydrolase [Peptoclostridium litorale]KDR96686.1 Cof-like hydrolase [Peptoclostridium litorale DSM 5388]SIN67734.1 hypothetical protein SAMN02745945_00061 [Peptoclostridium litorale DSM 5388]